MHASTIIMLGRRLGALFAVLLILFTTTTRLEAQDVVAVGDESRVIYVTLSVNFAN